MLHSENKKSEKQRKKQTKIFKILWVKKLGLKGISGVAFFFGGGGVCGSDISKLWGV